NGSTTRLPGARSPSQHAEEFLGAGIVMTESRDEDRDDPEYWNALADRVVSSAIQNAGSGVLEWLAQSRAGWTAGLLLALAALLCMMSQGGRPAGDKRPAALNVILPADEIEKAMADGDQPPPISELLIEPRDARLP